MRIPKHIAIIPDGNRRWALSHGYPKQEGYGYGILPGLSALRTAAKYDIKEITYYGFTTDNCHRPKAQVEAFRKACVDAVEQIKREDTALLVVGDEASPYFPEELRPYCKRTSFGSGKTKVNFLVNYGWEWDMSGTERGNTPLSRLRSKEIPNIDLVIRWGGRRRLSGLLPVQSVYADFYIIDKLWPEFRSEDITAALNWYDKQDITRGG